MNENKIDNSDEINLLELFEKLKSGWRFLAGGAAIGLTFSLLIILITPSKYEAQALIQIGQFNQIGQIEISSVVAERVESPIFKREVTKLSGLTDYDLIANIKGNSSLVLIRTRSGSKDDAEKAINTAVKLLIEKHAESYEARIKRIDNEIEIGKQRLAVLENDILSIDRNVPRVGAKVDQSQLMSVGLLTSLRLQKTTEAIATRQAILTNETQLLPPATQPTKVLDAVFVGEKPVYPKKSFLIVLGLGGGFFVGAILLLLLNYIKRLKGAKPL